MEENHYIEWIEVIADGKNYKEFLNPERLCACFANHCPSGHITVDKRLRYASPKLYDIFLPVLYD